MKREFLLLAGVLLAGATLSHAVTLPDACGSDQVKFDVKVQRSHSAVPDAAAGQAQVVFVEQLSLQGMGFCMGCDITTRVGMDGKWVGANHGNSYFMVSVTPGEHHLCVNWQSNLRSRAQKAQALAFTAEAGKTYYFETDVQMKSRDAGMGQVDVEDTLHVKPVGADQGAYLAKISAMSQWKAKK